MTKLHTLALALLTMPLTAQGVGLRLTNGIDAYVDVPYAPTLAPRSGVTVEAWVTYDDATLGAGWRWPTIVRQNSTPQVVNYMLRIEAGQTNNPVLGWTVRTPAGVRQALWRFASGQLNTWTHVAATYDGANLRLFVNAMEVGAAAHSGALVDTPDTLRIGNGDLSAAGIEEWNGEIDEVRLWPFARTAAEIAATMNLELGGVPGEVSTWNLNASLTDTSGTNHGVAVNGPTIATNTLVLTALPALGAANFGVATAGCNGAPRSVLTSAPRVGSAEFALGTVRATASGSGLLWLGTSRLPTPIVFLGVTLLIDPATPNVQVPIGGGPLGFSRVPLPIPANRFLVNRSLFFQTVWTEPTCAVPLFAADGLAFVILP